MSFEIKNKKFQILLFSLIFTIVIFAINKNSNLSINSLEEQTFNFRSLLSNDKVDARCKKTQNDFLEKYKEEYNYLSPKNDSLSKYQKVLKDMIENKNYSKNIKKYLPRIVMYFIFIIVDILLIIVWILFCGCCCCNKNKKSSSSVCGKCSFIIYLILSLLVILLCVLGYFLSPIFNKSINGVVCSLYKLIFHFIEGTKDDYSSSKWKGVDGLEKLISEFSNTYDEIDKLNPITEDEDNCKSSNDVDYCKIYNEVVNNIKSEKNDGFKDELENSKEEIYKISDTFRSIKDDTLENIENIMEKVDKYFKLSFIGLISVILLFCFLGLLALIIYFTCNCECISCLYHIFWNIEMIIIIITLLVGICFGIIGVVSKDAIPILQDAKSTEYLEQGKFLFLDIDQQNKEKIDICFNGDGNLMKKVFNNENNYKNSIDDEEYKKFEDNFAKLKEEEEFGKKNDLVKDYQELEEILKKLKYLNDNLNSDNLEKIFNCKFVGSDFNILIEEINDSLAKKLSLYSLVIIIADLASVISIFFGITVINNYKGQNVVQSNESNARENRSRNREVKNNMDSSSDNLRK